MDDIEEITIESFNTPEMYARETQAVFLRNAVAAAEEVVRLALHASTERMRLDASKYVVDHVLGKIELKLTNKDGVVEEPWTDLFSAVIREPTASERAQGKRPR